ncbi:DNA polymerase III [Nitrosospira lacus]|uniref:Type-4 uracil-DNA glycosylase n=1 Tax=Nitrosospira lacus TaxID=1288494 RepID=A0A1W6SSC9_9PROT|nr:uracil-DNA glycosylase [Nitrosospira lacus]ARO88714.1 DNA polymerase III [Nitrosospira lacus]
MTAAGPSRRARRNEILKELGLTPLWHVRASGEDSAAQVDSSEHVVSHPAGAAEERRSKILRMGWDELKTSVEGCVACPLCQSRSRTVFGVGDKNADWLCVGEGPGAEEDAKGEPFVGPSGKLLDNMLAAINLRRGRDVYITNIVKCRPPGNRNPSPDEAGQCSPYLERQIQLIKPKLIIALGKVATQNLLHTDAAIASLRGRLHDHSGIPVIVTYHPAYLLRTLVDKAKVWEDLCFARSIMQGLGPSG